MAVNVQALAKSAMLMPQVGCNGTVTQSRLVMISPASRSILAVTRSSHPSKHSASFCRPRSSRQISGSIHFQLRKRDIFPPSAAGGGDTGGNDGGNKGGGDGGDSGDSSTPPEEEPPSNGSWILGSLARGWQARVDADAQFPFKVLCEQLIGVTACVIGDMASRPNFGLNELDFVFSTLVVGSILNFLLMYMLAPTTVLASAAPSLPWIFSSCPPGHMFQPGSFGLGQRLGTFVFKAVQFGSVGFVAGLGGTVISNVLLEVRKKLQPGFELQNEAPPTLLSAATWGLHLAFSSNFRYQALNGLDLILQQALPPSGFKTYVFLIRGINNVIGGSTFVMLAKLMGAQKSGTEENKSAE